MTVIKIGFVGFGHRAAGSGKNELSGIATCMLQNENFEIIRVCDLRESRRQRAKRFLGEHIKVTDDYREIIDDKSIDAVIVTVPQYLHRQIAIEALQNGKHVYCEKPMALTVLDCDAICEAADRSGKILIVGQQMRYHAHIHRMKDYIHRGDLGTPVMAWLREFRNPFPATMDWVFDKEKGGGMLMDKSCHHFDIFNWLLDDEPVSVYASGAPDVFPDAFQTGNILEDNAFVTVNYARGKRAMLHLCMFMGLPHISEGGVGHHNREIGVIGTKGMLRTEGFDLGRNLELRWNDKRNVMNETIELNGNVPDWCNQTGNVGILIDFAECIRTGRQPFAHGGIGRMAVAVALAGEKSMVEKRIVDIKEVIG